MYPKVVKKKICWGIHSQKKSMYDLKWTVLIIFKVIPEVKKKITEAHLKHTDYDGEFHLEWVEIIEFIWGSEPFWIEAERINTTFCFFSKLFNWSFIVATSKHIQGKGKELVVNPACIKWEKSHHEEQIPDLVNIRKHSFSSLTFQEPNTGSQQTAAVSNITEHDTEQEGENGDCVQGRVDFLISGNTISVNDFLEGRCECVCLDVGGVLCLWFHFSEWYERG